MEWCVQACPPPLLPHPHVVEMVPGVKKRHEEFGEVVMRLLLGEGGWAPLPPSCHGSGRRVAKGSRPGKISEREPGWSVGCLTAHTHWIVCSPLIPRAASSSAWLPRRVGSPSVSPAQGGGREAGDQGAFHPQHAARPNRQGRRPALVTFTLQHHWEMPRLAAAVSQAMGNRHLRPKTWLTLFLFGAFYLTTLYF